MKLKELLERNIIKGCESILERLKDTTQDQTQEQKIMTTEEKNDTVYNFIREIVLSQNEDTLEDLDIFEPEIINNLYGKEFTENYNCLYNIILRTIGGLTLRAFIETVINDISTNENTEFVKDAVYRFLKSNYYITNNISHDDIYILTEFISLITNDNKENIKNNNKIEISDDKIEFLLRRINANGYDSIKQYLDIVFGNNLDQHISCSLLNTYFTDDDGNGHWINDEIYVEEFIEFFETIKKETW